MIEIMISVSWEENDGEETEEQNVSEETMKYSHGETNRILVRYVHTYYATIFSPYSHQRAQTLDSVSRSLGK